MELVLPIVPTSFNRTFHESSDITVVNHQKTGLWNYTKRLAEVVSSRESTYRAGLDLTGWEIPNILASAFRNKDSFFESLFMCSLDFGASLLVPSVNKLLGHIAARFIFNDKERENLNYLAFFKNTDLINLETLKTAAGKIKSDEIQDNEFLEKFFSNNKYSKEAQRIKSFFDNFSASEDLLEKLRKFKKSLILSSSTVVGAFMAHIPTLNRLFRKYVLGQNRFTGTEKYASDKDSEKIGDSGDLTLLQKLLLVIPTFASPIVNFSFLKKAETLRKDGNDKAADTILNNLDFTHGFYPTLAKFASIVAIPWNMSSLISAQGNSERIENLIRTCTLIPSWWFGHRVTNGLLAKKYDNDLASKFKVEKGIMLEPKYLNSLAPEPALIQHIFDRTENQPELRDEARNSYAKAMFGGFTLHSLMIFVMRILLNKFTKFRVENALTKTQLP